MPLVSRQAEAEAAPAGRRAGRVVLVRSVAFNVLFAASILVTASVSAPVVLLLPRRCALAVAKWWSRASLVLLKWIVGIELEVRGLENVPKGAALIAAKHQSALETFGLMPHLPDGVFVLKRELTWIPLFGWFLRRLRMIAINRATGGEALLQILEQSEAARLEGRQIVIFPEGTRRPVGAPPRYRLGATYLYDRLKLPCVPVAIDTGVFWPRRTLRRRQGRAVLAFLEPIPAGLSREVFDRTLRERLETATDALVAESLGGAPERKRTIFDRSC